MTVYNMGYLMGEGSDYCEGTPELNLRDVGRRLSLHHIYRTYISKKSLGANFVLLISNNIVLVYGAANYLQFSSLASIIELTVVGLLYNLIEETTSLISAGVIFTVFILSFRLLRLN
jgi:hypothetical protein